MFESSMDHRRPIEKVLPLLDGVFKIKPNEWMAYIPGSDDGAKHGRRGTRNAGQSLHVSEASDGKVLMHSFRPDGKPTGPEVAEALGLSPADLFPATSLGGHPSVATPVVTAYQYVDEHGQLLQTQTRTDYPDGGKRFSQAWVGANGEMVKKKPSGFQPIPYNLHGLLAEPDRWIIDVEGEKCADAAIQMGLLAITWPGGASGPLPDLMPEYFRSHAGVCILVDNDPAGEACGTRKAGWYADHGMRVKIVRLPGLVPKGDLYDFRAAGGTKSDVISICKVTPVWEGAGSGAPTAPDPTYAMSVFPEGVRLPDAAWGWIEAGARSIGVPIEMVFFAFLALVGGMVGDRAAIELKRGYFQYASLWIAIIADPGSGKSPAISHARRVFEKLQFNYVEAYRDALRQFEEKDQRWKSSKDDEKGPKPLRPNLRHVFSTDATIEAVARVLESSPGLTLVVDELSGLILGDGQYKQGAKGTDRSKFMTMWSDAFLKVDRAGQESRIITNTVLSIVGGITTDNAPLLHNEKGIRDGWLERFIILRPSCEPEWNEDDIPDHLFASAITLLKQIDSLPSHDTNAGFKVKLSAEAKREWVAWHGENRAAQMQVSGVAAGITSKLKDQVARIALILHLLKHAEDPRVMITVETMIDAIALGEFIREQFHLSLPLLGQSAGPRVSGLQSRILRILRNEDLHESDGYVSRRTIIKKLSNTSSDDLTDALETLKSESLIEIRMTPTAGRPREEWRVVKGDVFDFPQRSSKPLKSTGIEGIDLQPGEEVF